MKYDKRLKKVKGEPISNVVHSMINYQDLISKMNKKEIYDISNKKNRFSKIITQMEVFGKTKKQEYNESLKIFSRHIQEIQKQNKNNFKHVNIYVSMPNKHIKIREESVEKYSSLKNVFNNFYLKGYYLNFIAKGKNKIHIEELIKNNRIEEKIFKHITNKNKYYSYDYIKTLNNYLNTLMFQTVDINDFYKDEDSEEKMFKKFESHCLSCQKTGDYWYALKTLWDEDRPKINPLMIYKKWLDDNFNKIIENNIEYGLSKTILYAEFIKDYHQKNPCSCQENKKMNQKFLEDKTVNFI